MIKITREVAEADFEKFATAFRLDPIKRKRIFSENSEGQKTIDGIFELIEAGMVSVNDDGSLIYAVLEPLVADSGNVVLENIELKPKRIKLNDFQSIEKIKDDSDKMLKILSLISGVNVPMLSKLSMDDINYLSMLTLVFM